MLTYFEKLKSYSPDVVEAGAPILINEVAIIKDTVENEILLRITMANSSEVTAIAIATEISMWDIFGEVVPAGNSTTMNYVYQDIFFAPRSVYGNTVPISVPDSVRKVDVRITKVVFADETVWKTTPENYVHVQPQDLLEGTDDFLDTLRDEGEQYPPLLTYVENDECWQCTCGGVNLLASPYCYRCKRAKDTCASDFSAGIVHDKYLAFIDAKEKLAEKKRIEEGKKAKEEQYSKAVSLLSSSISISDYKRARSAFKNLGDYKDSIDLEQKCKSRIERLQKEEEIKREIKEIEKKKRAGIILVSAITACIAIVLSIIVFKVLLPEKNYHAALTMIDEENYDGAIEILRRLGDYKDCGERIEECKLRIAESLMEEEEYEAAIEIFRELGNYNNSEDKIKECEALITMGEEYEKAKVFIKQEYYISAYKLLTSLKNYKDSNELRSSIIHNYVDEIISTAKVGSTIVWGSYEQDNVSSNGKEEIEWIILDKKKDKILLVSRYAIENKAFHLVPTWLNSAFIQDAFTVDEATFIPTIEIALGKDIDDLGDYDGKDKVFLLSAQQVQEYSNSIKTLPYCRATPYALKAGVYANSINENCWWWLRRSSGFDNGSVAEVTAFGDVATSEIQGSSTNRGVRPAIWIIKPKEAEETKEGSVTEEVITEAITEEAPKESLSQKEERQHETKDTDYLLSIETKDELKDLVGLLGKKHEVIRHISWLDYTIDDPSMGTMSGKANEASLYKIAASDVNLLGYNVTCKFAFSGDILTVIEFDFQDISPRVGSNYFVSKLTNVINCDPNYESQVTSYGLKTVKWKDWYSAVLECLSERLDDGTLSVKRFSARQK